MFCLPPAAGERQEHPGRQITHAFRFRLHQYPGIWNTGMDSRPGLTTTSPSSGTEQVEVIPARYLQMRCWNVRADAVGVRNKGALQRLSIGGGKAEGFLKLIPASAVALYQPLACSSVHGSCWNQSDLNA